MRGLLRACGIPKLDVSQSPRRCCPHALHNEPDWHADHGCAVMQLAASLRASAYPYVALLAFSGARTRLIVSVQVILQVMLRDLDTISCHGKLARAKSCFIHVDAASLTGVYAEQPVGRRTKVPGQATLERKVKGR